MGLLINVSSLASQPKKLVKTAIQGHNFPIGTHARKPHACSSYTKLSVAIDSIVEDISIVQSHYDHVKHASKLTS